MNVKLYETPNIDVLRVAIANFATKGFSQFSLRLKVTRRAESRPQQSRQVLLGDFTPVDFKILHIKGKGKLSSFFSQMDPYGTLLRGDAALRGKFKLNYVMEFTKNRERSVLVNTYPVFFPNWMSTIPLFNAINLCIIKYETKAVALDINCTPLNLRTDGTADIYARGLLVLSSFHRGYEIRDPFELTAAGCVIEMVNAELRANF